MKEIFYLQGLNRKILERDDQRTTLAGFPRRCWGCIVEPGKLSRIYHCIYPTRFFGSSIKYHVAQIFFEEFRKLSRSSFLGQVIGERSQKQMPSPTPSWCSIEQLPDALMNDKL
jgi:hypothetical protein